VKGVEGNGEKVVGLEGMGTDGVGRWSRRRGVLKGAGVGLCREDR